MKPSKICAALSLFAFVLTLGVTFSPRAFANQIMSFSDTLNSISSSAYANHSISFTTADGVAAGETMTLVFPSNFEIGSVGHGDIDVADDGVDLTLGATASGSTWGASFSGQTLTITSDTGTIAAGSAVSIEIGTHASYQSTGTSQIRNPAAAGSYVLSLGGTFGGSSQLGIPVVEDNQVFISAVVNNDVSTPSEESGDSDAGGGEVVRGGGGSGLRSSPGSSADDEEEYDEEYDEEHEYDEEEYTEEDEEAYDEEEATEEN